MPNEDKELPAEYHESDGDEQYNPPLCRVARGRRGRERGRGRGRAPVRGRQRQAGHDSGNDADDEVMTRSDSDDAENVGELPEFHPVRAPGIHIPAGANPLQELEFFNLYVGQDVLQKIADATNEYAWMHILAHPCYADKDGGWCECSAEEIRKLIGFLLYMSLNKLPKLADYWRVTSLFNGTWARAFIPTRNRFQLLCLSSTLASQQKRTGTTSCASFAGSMIT